MCEEFKGKLKISYNNGRKDKYALNMNTNMYFYNDEISVEDFFETVIGFARLIGWTDTTINRVLHNYLNEN